MASVAALAALNLQRTLDGAVLVASVEGKHQQAPCWAALMEAMASVAASLAAQDPQPTPDGAALVALVEGRHQQAPCWAALVSLVPLGHWRS